MATGIGTTALGNGSVADGENTNSVGAVGTELHIAHGRAGNDETDAVKE